MQPFDKNKSITVDYFKEVAKLGDGKSFGELALLKNAGRAATIICAEPTRFATLHRKDYKLTIGAEVRRKLKENVRMLRQFRIFSSSQLKNNAVEKVFQYMKVCKYKHGHTVYKENQSKISGLYFIKSGDFEVS